MKEYHELMQYVLFNGTPKPDRTGTGARSVFGYQMRFDLRGGFPLVTTKKIHFKSVVAELLWFLSGSTNNNDLRALGCTIWDEWAKPNGDLGPIYGKQWRRWEGEVLDIDATPVSHDGSKMSFTAKVTHAMIDQITQVIDGIKRDPNGRRHIVSAWNPADIPKMALAPCHALFQFDVTGGRLSCQLYQRSADIFIGVPFNIASYALLTHMVAQQCDLEVGDFVWTGGNCHLYENHLKQAALQLGRIPRKLPRLSFARRPESIFDYKPEDIILTGYDPEPHIKAPVAI